MCIVQCVRCVDACAVHFLRQRVQCLCVCEGESGRNQQATRPEHTHNVNTQREAKNNNNTHTHTHTHTHTYTHTYIHTHTHTHTKEPPRDPMTNTRTNTQQTKTHTKTTRSARTKKRDQQEDYTERAADDREMCSGLSVPGWLSAPAGICGGFSETQTHPAPYHRSAGRCGSRRVPPVQRTQRPRRKVFDGRTFVAGRPCERSCHSPSQCDLPSAPTAA
jgi:hypothetical protein